MAVSKADRAAAERRYVALLREEQAREQARELQNALVCQHCGDGVRHETFDRVANRRASVEAQADPLHLTSRPKADCTARATGKAAASVRRERDARMRKVDVIERLSRGDGAVISPRLVRIARDVEYLFEQAAGGAVIHAIDWRQPKVDGGKGWRELARLGNVCDAERRLLAIRMEIGRYHFQVLARVVRDCQSVTAIAMDFERSEEAKANGACSRRAKDHVSRLLVEALKGAADVAAGAVAARG